MSNAKAAQVVDTLAEPKTAAEWQQNIEEYELTLAGPTLEPAIKAAIEKLRADAVQRKFLTEVTAPAVNDAPAQQFVTPKVPDVMPVAIAESLKMWDGQIAEVETFLKNNPLPQLIPGANLHYSREWITDEFFVRARQGCDEDRIWLDRGTDSKVFSEVHGRILTRRETLRVSA